MPPKITPSAFSAPGKVLLAGGYLVLDKEYSGLVFALSARIHAISSPAEGESTITVRSPQFSGAEWGYTIEFPADGSEGGVVVTAAAGSSKNPFVETTVRYVLSYLSASPSFTAPIPSAVITIYADNDYYSQPSSATPLPRFNALDVPITSAHKTGLGSSAALTTSLTACLLSTYSPTAPSETHLHNLSQAAHCAAQGKVGSGFDVAAAVFGSCVYHRFSPSILEAVGDAGTAGFVGRLKEVVERPWDLRVRKTRVPPGLRLLMGDVDCGSSTPGMVRSVLGWRKENAVVAKREWDAIQALNRELIGLLADAERRAEVTPDEYLQALNGLSNEGGVVSESSTLLQNIAEQIGAIREKIRAMGVAAGVPIEPEEQMRLLDGAVEATKGVLGGVVPGAGGYDAVVFLMADREDIVKSLNGYLNEYEFGREDGGKGTVVALGTREEHEGIRKEDTSAYGL